MLVSHFRFFFGLYPQLLQPGRKALKICAGFTGCGKSLRVVTFSPQSRGVGKKHAWRRREADGDVQLCDVGAADTGGS
ncbi:MAG TPA: hypothetical protein VGR47_23260, partial [Terracidiphilus sp.]|nr:hypothetical protein [Terracidiphilus sp.]